MTITRLPKNRQEWVEFSVIGTFVVAGISLALQVVMMMHPEKSQLSGGLRYVPLGIFVAAITLNGVLHYKASKLRTIPSAVQRTRATIFVSSPGISFKLLSNRTKAQLDLILFTSNPVELSHLKVIAEIKKGNESYELCVFEENGPAEIAGQHRKIMNAPIATQAMEKLSPGCTVTLSGAATFRENGFRYEPINVVTVAAIEGFSASLASQSYPSG